MYNQMLRGRIVQKYGSLKNFAAPLGVSYVTLIHKLKGLREWTASEIETLVDLLEIDPNQIPLYFFNRKV